MTTTGRDITMALGCTALIALLTLAFPGATVCGTSVASLAVLIPAYLALRGLGIRSTSSMWVLWAGWLMMCAGMVVNMHYFTDVCGGTPDDPVLYNNDADAAWSIATGGEKALSRMAYGMLLRGIACITGPNLLIFSALNVLASLLTVILTGGVAGRLLPDRKSAPALAMALMCLVSYFVADSSLLLKDSLCALTVAILAYGQSRRMTDTAGGWPWVASALIMGAYLRPNVLPILCVGLAFTSPWKGKGAILSTVPIVIGLAVWRMLYNVTAPEVEDVASVAVDETNRLGAYARLAGEYGTSTLLHKILLLPVSVVVQFLLPLPWHYLKHLSFGPTLVWAHFAYPWYLMGGVLLYGLTSWRRMPRQLLLLTLGGAAMYAATAFATAGLTSRYALMWLSWLIPCVAWVLINERRRKTFLRWMVIYSLAIGITLAGLYMFNPGNSTL